MPTLVAACRTLNRSSALLAAVLVLLVTTSLAVPTASADDAGAVEFGFTGSPQTWTVPDGVTSIGVDAQGAQGAGVFGGLGGWTHAVLDVTPGQVLHVHVGGRGTGSATGWNGGGGGGCCDHSAAGGGATDIRIGGTENSDRVLVAGGGGGSLGDSVSGQGGAGGDLVGGAGGDGSGEWRGGRGGTQTAGGTGGGSFANPGTLGQGGTAGYAAGSGGGGYYGGGAGGGDSSGGSSGGGGGGSSYAAPAATAVTFQIGTRRGDGHLTISYPPREIPPTDVSPSAETFKFTGGPQFYRVPAGVTQLQVDASGAQGGTPEGTGGGLGGTTQASIPVQPFQLVNVNVGGVGNRTSAGWNGGGGGGCCDRNAAGGGASDVRINGLTLADRRLVAGGGGGGGAHPFGGESGGAGGAGGGLDGSKGVNGSGQWVGGGGGSQASGGTAGPTDRAANFADPGRPGVGGVGHFGGSGGGGYYGGGGGEGDSYAGTAAGGGGGSGYVTPDAVEVTHSVGANAGDGTVTVTAIRSSTPTPTPSPTVASARILSIKRVQLTPTTPLYEIPLSIQLADVSCPSKIQMSLGIIGQPLVRKTVKVCGSGESAKSEILTTVAVFDSDTGSYAYPGRKNSLDASITGGHTYNTDIELPPAPRWVAVGDSYSSGHHQDLDQPIYPHCFSIPNGADSVYCSLKWNDYDWAWPRRATLQINKELGVPGAWQMAQVSVARSGAKADDFTNQRQPSGSCPGCSQMRGALGSLQLAPGSWNILSISGGANDAEFADVLKTYYKSHPSGKPWAAKKASECPNTKLVQKRASATQSDVAESLRTVASAAQAQEPGLRIVNINYPEVVTSSSPCYGEPFGRNSGAHSVVDTLNRTQHLGLEGLSGVHWVDLRELLGKENPLPRLQLNRYWGYPHVNSSGQDRIALNAAEKLLAGVAPPG